MLSKISYNRSKCYMLATCIFYVCIMQGLFLRPLAGPDCYNAIMDPDAYYKAALYGSGRFVHAFYFWIIASIGRLISVQAAYYGSFMLNGFFLVLSLYRYSTVAIEMLQIRIDDIKSVVPLSVLSCITIVNIFICEYFLYPESMFIFVTWLNVEAVVLYWRMIDRKNKYLNIAIIGLLALSGFGYQIIPAVYLVLTLPMVLVKSDTIKLFVSNQVMTGLHYIAGVLPGSVFAKLIVRSPRGEFRPESIFDTVSINKPQDADVRTYVFDRITSGMWVYVVVCLIIAVLLLIAAFRGKEYIEIVKGMYIVLVTVFMGILPFIIGVTSDYRPRIYYVIGTLFGTLTLYGLLKGYLTIGKEVAYIICECAAIIMIFVQFANFGDIARERYITNYEDRYISCMIGREIDKYENESGESISKVVFYQDSHRTKYISEKGWCLSMRAYGVDWGNSSALNYYLGRNYQIGKMDEDVAMKFALEDWSSFSEDQIVFKGDTAHICRY